MRYPLPRHNAGEAVQRKATLTKVFRQQLRHRNTGAVRQIARVEDEAIESRRNIQQEFGDFVALCHVTRRLIVEREALLQECERLLRIFKVERARSNNPQ